jgi:hypothetical protein
VIVESGDLVFAELGTRASPFEDIRRMPSIFLPDAT